MSENKSELQLAIEDLKNDWNKQSTKSKIGIVLFGLFLCALAPFVILLFLAIIKYVLIFAFNILKGLWWLVTV